MAHRAEDVEFVEREQRPDEIGSSITRLLNIDLLPRIKRINEGPPLRGPPQAIPTPTRTLPQR